MEPGQQNPLQLKARTPAEVDALVGKHLVGETPRVYWEDARTRLHFESLDEAREAAQDPFFSRLNASEGRADLVFTQHHEFRHYSTQLEAAWDVVENIGLVSGRALSIRWEGGQWVAMFDGSAIVKAKTAPLAICLAALRFHGIEVEIAF